MTTLTHLIDKAIAELAIAKRQPALSEAALIQAKDHVLRALDEARRQKHAPIVCVDRNESIIECIK